MVGKQLRQKENTLTGHRFHGLKVKAETLPQQQCMGEE
jgi:hypothetical protein